MLAAILAALAFAPVVQTLVAQAVLAWSPTIHGSVGSLSAGFGKVEVQDLHLEFDGAVLTMPSVQGRLPLISAAWDRKLFIQSLAAKDWTLDLRGIRKAQVERAGAAAAPGASAEAQPAKGEASPAQMVADALHNILSVWKVPFDASLDGVDLEGDVVIPVQSGKASTRLHVIIKGGGLAAGRDGEFTFDASNAVVNSDLSVIVYAAQGRLAAALASSRALDRIEIKADLSAKGGSLPQDVDLSADIAAARGTGEEDYTLDLGRGSRHIATVSARFPEATGRLAGTWKADLRDSDLAPFFPDNSLPAVTAAGGGQFDSDAAFEQVHVLGRLNGTASRLGVLAPPLDRVGPVAIDARFDLDQIGHTLRVDQLSISISATGSNALVQSLQSFVVDENTGALKVADSSGDWMDGKFQGLPVALLSGPNDVLAFAAGNANGDFAIRAVNGELSLRSKAPFTATGVSLQRAGSVIARGLDLSLALLVDRASDGWQVEGAPLTLGSGGRRLATVQAKAGRHGGAGQSITITGTWDADLEALAAQQSIPGIGWLTGRSAAGDFSADLGFPADVDVKLTAVGHDPSKSVAGSIHVDFNSDGSVGFLAPFKMAIGTSVSDLSAEGTWVRDQSGARIEAKLTGPNADFEHLRLLAAVSAAAAGIPFPSISAARLESAQTSADARDRTPFWGDWAGSVTFGFDRLREGNRDLAGVAGTFDIDPRSLRLKYGRAVLPPHRSQATAEGSISFDGAAAIPYRLNAATSIKEVEAAPFFGTPKDGEDPVVEGHFSIASTLTGDGKSLEDLVSHTQAALHLASTTGIVRLLKTNVAESLPEVTTPVSDTLGSVGSLMGSLIGIKHDPTKGAEIHLNKTTQGVLDFTNQVSEIGYDQVTVDAIRRGDGSIQISDIVMTAPNERLTGSGQIRYVGGLSLPAQPLSLELLVSARGPVAELLSNTGLLSAQKDKLGYTPLNQTVHFGGTLGHIDDGPWHDLLVKAATPKPGEGSKPAEKGGP